MPLISDPPERRRMIIIDHNAAASTYTVGEKVVAEHPAYLVGGGGKQKLETFWGAEVMSIDPRGGGLRLLFDDTDTCDWSVPPLPPEPRATPGAARCL